jgi:4-amino-4-deoxy-L-arabinose transferase-like glycosyltransferase
MPDTTAEGTRPASASRDGWWILVAVALLLYLVLALYQLDLPGLNYDETLDAVPAMQVVQHQRVDSFATLKIGGRSWPLMTMPYVGVTTTHILMPVFALFGASVTTVRGTAVLIGLISLLLSFGFLRELFDRRVAALSILLLAVNPSFVFWSRMGAWVQLVLFPITILALWSLFRWYRRRQSGYLVLAGFMLGLGLGSHIQFFWMWVALPLAWLVLSPWLGTGRGWRRWAWPWQRAKPGVWLLSLAALLLGAAPILIYNVKSLGTFQYALDSVAAEEVGRAPGLQGAGAVVVQHLRELPGMALGTFETLLSGDWFGSKLGGPYRNPIAVWAFGLALIVMLGLAFGRRLNYRWKRIAFLLVLLVSIVLQSVIVTSAESTHHLLIVWPIPQALVSIALFGLADMVSSASPTRQRAWLAVLGTAAVILVGAEVMTTYRYHRALTRTGGVGLFSDAIYTLASDLEKPGAPKPIAMDWGFRRNLQLLTQNRVDASEWFTYTPPGKSEYEGYVQALIERYPDARYLFHVPKYTAFPGHREVFEDVAYRRHLSPVLWKTYYQRDGAPVYQVYTLETTPPLFEAPPMDHALDVELGQRLALLGYDGPQAQINPGGDVRLTLYWKALAEQAGNYKVFAHLIDDSGKVWGQHDDFPTYGSHPMTEWQRDEIISDHIRIEVPEDVPPGVYHVFVGMYDSSTGERLELLRDGQRLKGDTMGLTDVKIG